MSFMLQNPTLHCRSVGYRVSQALLIFLFTLTGQVFAQARLDKEGVTLYWGGGSRCGRFRKTFP